SLTLERGAGHGYFQHWADQSAGVGPRAIAVGDFNGDGKLDLAVANFASDNVSVLLGIGDGTFREFGSLQVNSRSAIVAAGFNRDGQTDLAVVDSISNSVVIFQGLGN